MHSTWYYTSLISELISRIVLVTVVGLVCEDGNCDFEDVRDNSSPKIVMSFNIRYKIMY